MEYFFGDNCKHVLCAGEAEKVKDILTLEYNRLILNRLAERLGRDNPLVIEQSERVDGLVMRLQGLM